MALQLTVTRSQNNLRAEFLKGYHRILEVRQDQDQGKVFVKVGTYADEGARRYQDMQPQDRPGPMPGMMGGQRVITEHVYDFNMADFKTVIATLPDSVLHADLSVAAGYELLKTKVEKFRNAESV